MENFVMPRAGECPLCDGSDGGRSALSVGKCQWWPITITIIVPGARLVVTKRAADSALVAGSELVVIVSCFK